MRKDVKFVVAVACLVLVGLLAYVLFAPGHKKTAEVTDEVTAPEAGGNSTTETQAPSSVAPATQPSISLSPSTQPSAPMAAAPVVPSVDSNVAVSNTGTGGATDWDKTLNSGTLAGGASGAAAGSNTLIAATTDNLSGASVNGMMSGATTRPSMAGALGGSNSLSGSAVGGSKTHKVAFGETLSSIAQEAYGNRAYYTKIVAANPGINPNRLKVGTVLNIPDVKGGEQAESTELSSGGTTGGSGAAVSGNTYSVKPGDSLQRISNRLYGSTDKWQKIYELNRTKIGADPHRLRAGMVLKLPEAPTSASTASIH